MKKHLFLRLSILYILFSCSSKKSIQSQTQDKVILQIEAKNLKNQKAYLQNADGTFYLNNFGNGKFIDTLNINQGYYKLNIGEEYAFIYLKPGYNLKITLDANQFDETIHYDGVGSDNNNFLAQEMLFNEKLGDKTNPRFFIRQDESKFLSGQDSVYNAFLDNLKKANLKDKEFIGLTAKKYIVERNRNYQMYKMIRNYNLKKRISDSFPSDLQDLDLQDYSWLKVPGFIDVVSEHFLSDANKELKTKIENKQMDEKELKSGNFDYYLYKLKYVNDKLKENPKLKESVLYNIAKTDFSFVKKKNDYYNFYNQVVNTKKFVEPIKKQYESFALVSPGKPSPDFTVYDIDGKEYHIKDFKGKALYIDLWATWCAPCVAEIPHLEKLKEKYKNKDINFVSISIWDDKAKWEKYVKTGRVKGIQLISTDKEMDFLKKYVVKGIPHFILLDKNGIIIDNHAPRPSNPALIELLDKALKK